MADPMTLAATSGTITMMAGPKKAPGWCDEQGIKHSWVGGPTLTSNPGWATRYCENCGKRQRQSLAEQPWQDE
jgi:hypothetical protein